MCIEAHDRLSIDLPGAQTELVSAVYAANPKTVLIISSNSPVAVNWDQQDRLQAIVGGHFLGHEQGRALAEALFGDYNPGGKLSTTWYAKTGDLPDFHDYSLMAGRTYLHFRGSPFYPFGHGLSYTTFRHGNLQLSGATLGPGETLTIGIRMTNTGSREGDEVVQLYVHASTDANKVLLPLKQLVNFERIHLKPNETTTVKLLLQHSDRALRYWDVAKRTLVPVNGAIDLMIGSSSEDIRLKTTVQMS